MTPLPYTDTGARIAFYVTIGVFVLLEQRTRLRSVLNRHGSRSDQGSLLVVIASVAAGVVAAFLLASDVPWAAITPARWGVFVAGLVLMWAGISLRQWAITLLGRFFTVDVRIQSGQTVIDRGPYRYVRHPSYSGMIVTFLGMGLALGNWLSLLAMAVVPTAGLIVRIHVEERTLLTALDALPNGQIDVTGLPDDLARRLFEALRLEIRYDPDSRRTLYRITLTGDTTSAAQQAAHDAVVLLFTRRHRTNRAIVDTADAEPAEDDPPVPILVVPPAGFEPALPPPEGESRMIGQRWGTLKASNSGGFSADSRRSRLAIVEPGVAPVLPRQDHHFECRAGGTGAASQKSDM